jgi:hypothetical protein
MANYVKRWTHPDGPMAARSAICTECGTRKDAHSYSSATGLLCPLGAYADRPEDCPCAYHRPGSPYIHTTNCAHCAPRRAGVDATNVNVAGDVHLENIQGGVCGTNVNVSGGVTIRNVRG